MSKEKVFTVNTTDQSVTMNDPVAWAALLKEKDITPEQVKGIHDVTNQYHTDMLSVGATHSSKHFQDKEATITSVVPGETGSPNVTVAVKPTDKGGKPNIVGSLEYNDVPLKGFKRVINKAYKDEYASRE